ncbi:MAG: helix-hairpin-helix domain-containing protein [Cocleimonas sp.]
MSFSLRKVLLLLVLSFAVSGSAMAKDSPSVTAKSAEGKAQYKRTTVNINRANAAALSAYLVGVGPVKAKAIVAYRSKNGKFSNVKDIMNVEGVGEGVFKGLKKNISTSRGETSAPKGYKMGSATAKKSSSSSKKKSSTAKKSTTTKSKSKSTSKSKSDSKSTTAKKSSSKAKSKTSAKKKPTKKKTSKKKTKSSKDKKKKKSKKKDKK